MHDTPNRANTRRAKKKISCASFAPSSHQLDPPAHMRSINNSIKINVAYFEKKNLNVLQIDSNLL